MSYARAVSRLSAGLWVLLVGCAVPTKVGDLPAEQGDGATDGAAPGTSSSGADGALTTTTTSSSTASSGSEGSTGSAVAPEMVSFAVRWGDIPDDPGDEPTASGDAGDGDRVPDDLLVVVGLSAKTCNDPFGDVCDTWAVSFVLTTDQQVPGTYTGDAVNLGFFENGSSDGAGGCAPFGGGTLEADVIIESIDDSGISLRFEAVDNPLGDVDLEGAAFSVSRC